MPGDMRVGFREMVALRSDWPVDASKTWPSRVQRSPGGVGGSATAPLPPLGLRVGGPTITPAPTWPFCALSANGTTGSTARLRIFDLQLHMRRRTGVRRNRERESLQEIGKA